MNKWIVDDNQARNACLNINESFIVQAPAGSGKTELLTQRLLALLATANQPENIIAITFTRKAAGEMRNRVLQSLKSALNAPAPQMEHEKRTWSLAQKALQQNDKKQWQLLENPNRLRIMTLDSLAAMLTQQMPILTGFGAKPDICEDATKFYELAVEQFILQDHQPEINAAIDDLLLLFDNQAETIKRLLVQLLNTRDQWLPHIIPYHQNPQQLKQHLTQSLAAITTDILQQVYAAWPKNDLIEWANLLEFSYDHLELTNERKNISLQPEINNINHWQHLADIILTKQNTVRKTLTKQHGFPAATGADKTEQLRRKQHKSLAIELLNAARDDDNLILALSTLRNAPPTEFSPQTWDSLSTLIKLLPWLVASLKCIFQATGQIDFNELTLGALRALGDCENPTELALKLDHQIMHLLIDEFQDTSIMQGQLISQLITEWMPNDGRSIFIVGDPMQSIYRFRNAEVSLFLQVQEHGIANLKPTPAKLSNNFRSLPNVINWVNNSFSTIFPQTAQPSIGGVPYSNACAQKSTESGISGTHVYEATAGIEDEAATIIKTIKNIQLTQENDSIAILVRTRHQLHAILDKLRHAEIPYQATEIDYLGQCPEIQDLLILTRALCHLGDRISWLALLRSPLFAFTLADCLAICQQAATKPLWSVLESTDIDCLLKQESNERLSILRPIIIHALKHINRASLADWIEQTWIALGAATTLEHPSQLAHCRRYFDLLAEHEANLSLATFTKALDKLFAEDQSSTTQSLTVMTIHKSKGLEFDHVILPNINYGKPPQTKSMLLWSTPAFSSGSSGLILGMLPNRINDCKIYDYLRYVEQQQLDQEVSRLFYVASTRARKSLHLLQIVKENQKNAKAGSFLRKIAHHSTTHLHPTTKDFQETNNTTPTTPRLWRVKNANLNPYLSFTRKMPEVGCNESNPIFLDPNSSIVGTVIHENLQNIADNTANNSWDRNTIEKRLLTHGMAQRNIKSCAELIESTTKSVCQDPTGKWILTNTHRESNSEYQITEYNKNTTRKHIIDRCFVDDTGIRWIIDYKTTSLVGDLASFMDKEQQEHRAQLNRYAKLFAHLPQPIRLGLYYPMFCGWHWWDYR